MLLLSKRQKLIIGWATLLLVLLIAGLLISFNVLNDNNEQAVDLYEDPNQLIQEIEESISNQVQFRYDEAETPVEKLNARLEFTTLAIRNNNPDEALTYAEEAIAIENLDISDRFSAAMNLVDVYGFRGEYETGLNKLAEIRSDVELMSVEKADFYVSRFEVAFKENKIPGPINCIEPKNPGDCPL